MKYKTKSYPSAVLLMMIFLSCLTITCFSTMKRIEPRVCADCENKLAMDGMKIGLVADSQIQTKNNTGFVLGMQGTIEDRVKKVSVRPPALNAVSINMLEYFLKDMIDNHKVGIVLYLGDAANNGCEDEIDTVFNTLRKFRDGTDSRKGKRTVPIFFLIGNHDYLGAGNTPLDEDRKKLCNCGSSKNCDDAEFNHMLAKHEVIQITHEFNMGNSKYSDWDYIDNFISGKVSESCKSKDTGKCPGCLFALFGKDSSGIRKKGCFLAGKITYKKDGSEILLFDTSDYYGKWYFKNEVFVKKKYMGLTGWISDEQIEFFKSKLGASPPVRIIATHYPKDDLAISDSKTRGILMDKMGSIITPEPGKKAIYGTYWISAHTHNRYTIWKNNDKDLPFEMLNIGSTTDAVYQKKKKIERDPSAMVTGLYMKDVDPNDNQSNFVTWELLMKNNREFRAHYMRVIAAVLREAKNKNGDYSKIKNIKINGKIGKDEDKGLVLFGIDRKYRMWVKSKLLIENKRTAKDNLEKMIKKISRRLRIKEEIVRCCIGLYSARIESGKEERHASEID
jgi:hypothetical protein